jgi:hypothetical protein
MLQDFKGHSGEATTSLVLSRISSQLISFSKYSLVFHPRTGDVGLNRINSNHPAHCKNCPHSSETVEHILLELVSY